jgi:hypothetical protein
LKCEGTKIWRDETLNNRSGISTQKQVLGKQENTRVDADDRELECIHLSKGKGKKLKLSLTCCEGP